MSRWLLQAERWLRGPFEIPRRATFDPSHVLLASFPRSGNTWMRFIFSHLSRLQGGHAVAVDFHSIHRYTPEVRYNRVLRDALLTPGLPLMLKTHFPFIPGFARYRSLLVVRDPADTMVSYHDYLQGEHGKQFGGLARFIRHWRYGMPGWVFFHETWAGRATTVMHFEELLADAPGSLQRALANLGYTVDPDVLAQAVAAASKRSMRQARQDKGDPHAGDARYPFVRKGKQGDGAATLSDADLRYVRDAARPILQRYGLTEGA